MPFAPIYNNLIVYDPHQPVNREETLIPELAIAMLACARIGAAHSVVFGGFSSESLRDRINDAQCNLLITADGGYRRGQIVPLKQTADEALTGTPSIAASSISPIPRPVFPLPVMPAMTPWVTRSDESYSSGSELSTARPR